MADKNCFEVYEDAMKKAGIELSGAQLNSIRSKYNVLSAIRENALKDPKVGTYQELSQKFYKDIQENSKRAAAEQAKELDSLVKNTNFIEQPAFKKGSDGPVEAFLTMMGQPTRPGNNIAESLQNKRATIEGRFRAFRDVEFAKNPGLEKIYVGYGPGSDGKLQVMKAIEALNRGETLAGYSKEVAKIAEIHVSVNKLILDTAHDLNTPMGNLKDRIMLREADVDKMIAATEDGWLEKQRGLKIDRPRTFGEFAGDAKMEEEILRRYYRYRTGGVAGALESIDAESSVFKSTLDRKAADRMDQIAKSRGIHYMDAESDWKNHADFASTSLAENLDNDIRNKSKLLALVDRFGPRPYEALEQLMKDTHKKLEAAGKAGDLEAGAQAEHLINTKGDYPKYNSRVLNAFDTYMGRNSIAPNLYVTETLSDKVKRTTVKGLQLSRDLTAVSSLGNHGLHALSSTPVGLYLAKNASGESLFSLMRNALSEHIKGVKPEFREHHFQELFQTANDMREQLEFYKGSPWEKTRDAAMRAIDFVGAARYGFDMPKLVATKSFLREASSALALGNNHINPQMKAYFLMGGIDEPRISVLRNALEVLDGKTVFTPAAIDRIPLSHPSLVEAAKTAGMAPRAYRTDLTLKAGTLLNMISSMVSHGVGIREQSLLHFGTTAGTVSGELTRSAMQFKSFPVHAFNAAEFITKAANINPEMLKAGVVDSTGRKMSVYTGLAMATAGMTIFTHMLVKAQTKGVKALINGKDPLEAAGKAFHLPDEKEIMESLLQNSVTGIVGDLAGGRKYGKNSNTFSGLAGPMLSQLDDAKDVLYPYGRGLFGKDMTPEARGKAAAHMVRRNLPFQNQALAKPFFDYFEHLVVDKMITTGAGAKFDENQQKYENPGQPVKKARRRK